MRRLLSARLLMAVSHWILAADDKRIRRKWVAKDFLSTLDFFNRVGRIAQVEEASKPIDRLQADANRRDHDLLIDQILFNEADALIDQWQDQTLEREGDNPPNPVLITVFFDKLVSKFIRTCNV